MPPSTTSLANMEASATGGGRTAGRWPAVVTTADVASAPGPDGEAARERLAADRATAFRNAGAGDGDGSPETLTVDSGMVEPAVPLNLALRVRVLAAERLIEITVVVGKRAGFPAARFADRDVTAQVVLPPGLELREGSLSWAGDLVGDQVVEFVAKVQATRDLDGVVEASATGYAVGGRVDADRERFHVVVSGGRPRVGLVPTPSAGTAAPRR